MHDFTEEARQWLDRRFDPNQKRQYRPHRSNLEFGQGLPGFLSNLGMACRIAGVLSSLEFDSVLDVGAADGFNSAFIGKLFNVPVMASDLSAEALARANERYGLVTAAIDSHKLPFKSDSFDCVVCNEVIEHVLDRSQLCLSYFAWQSGTSSSRRWSTSTFHSCAC
jgi:2-polyprenyl-3-methyl-5-hydroxy-6-metoxy-1,4-benzoquinol methylase